MPQIALGPFSVQAARPALCVPSGARTFLMVTPFPSATVHCAGDCDARFWKRTAAAEKLLRAALVCRLKALPPLNPDCPCAAGLLTGAVVPATVCKLAITVLMTVIG